VSLGRDLLRRLRESHRLLYQHGIERDEPEEVGGAGMMDFD
jgi:hypothetical protein